MTTVVSYRIYCDDCTNEKVIRERDMDNSAWLINDKYKHSGLCPACNPTADPEDKEYARAHREVAFETLDHIGEKGAENLREAGIVTYQDAQNATDEDILSTPWVGKKGLKSVRSEVT